MCYDTQWDVYFDNFLLHDLNFAIFLSGNVALISSSDDLR